MMASSSSSFPRILLVPWAGVCLYALLTLFSGSAGLLPYGKLLAEREKIYENIASLENANRELESTFESLRYDSDAITVLARSLGYGRADERFVRIVGVPPDYKALAPGTLKRAEIPPSFADTTLRIAAALSACAFFVILLLRNFAQSTQRELM